MHKLEFSLLAISHMHPEDSDTAILLRKLASISHHYDPPENKLLDVDDASVEKLRKIFDDEGKV